MISKIRDNRVFKILFAIFQILLMYRMVVNFEYGVERISQIPMYMLIAKGMLILYLIYFIYRIKIFKNAYTLITALICAWTIFIVLYIKNIHASTYGIDLYRNILFTSIIASCFIVVLVDLIFSHSFKDVIKKNGLVIAVFVILFAIAFPTHQMYFLVLALPVLTLLMTEIKKEKWSELTDYLAIGYYLAFLHLFTLSLIQNPDRYYMDRYLGSFSNIDTGGMFCGGALVCVIYLWFKYKDKFKRKWVALILAIALSLYPLYSMKLFSSRCTLFALLDLVIFAFIFMHGKGRKTTIIRGIISVGIIVLAAGGIIGLSYYIGYRYAGVPFDDIPYVLNRIMALTSKEFSSGIFGNDSILNNIDMALSGRLSGWYKSIEQIRFFGHAFEETTIILDFPIYTAHNFFIMWLINYGIIGGTVFLLWYIAEFVLFTKAAAAKKEYILFSVLWIYFTLSNYIFASTTWTYLVSVIFLLVQYPLIWAIQDFRTIIKEKKKDA